MSERILSLVVGVAAAAVIGCTPPAPMVAPAPLDLTASVTPALVVQRAAQRLTMDGFTITTSDATGGILTAALVRQGRGSWGPYLACRFADDAAGHVMGTATLTVRLTAQAVGSGSKVYVATSTLNVVNAGMLSGSSADDCASTGLAEQHVAAAIAPS